LRSILHIDMDAFYASVEERDDPSLKGKPLIVGGPSKRGVVSAASYAARPFGVRSAMSMGEALRRCPHAVVVPPRHDRYAEVSSEVFAIFRRFTPLVEGLSVDEAFLDVTASRSLFGEGEAIARSIKSAIKEELYLVASAGVAPCKFAAKIASDVEKPDGLVVVTAVGLHAFLAPLPIERMWGIGPKAAARLRPAGFDTFRDLAEAPLDRLVAILGRAGAVHVQTLARGIDDRPVIPGREAISLGHEETFEADLVDRRAMELRLLDIAGRVARRLHKAGLHASGVTLKVKYADFTLKTRSVTLPAPVADTKSLFDAALAMLDRAPRGRVRLLGITAGALQSADEGLDPTLPLFPDAAPEKRRRLEDVMVKIGDRFGDRGLRPAALLEEEIELEPPRGPRR
jgi:DNA polymerase IV